jgi:ABC-type taurine transport system ATPase subunit
VSINGINYGINYDINYGINYDNGVSPHLSLLDEPIPSLDPAARRQLINDLFDLVLNSGLP